MRSYSWRGLVAATLGLCSVGVHAQGTITDLGSLLAGQKNLTTFYSLIQKYPDILLQLPSYSGVTILAPNNDAFNKIPYTQLNSAFANNDQDTITNVLEYHILQGTKVAAQLVPGTPVFLPTLLTDSKWSNVTGGQRVENVEQSGNVVVFVSGQGSRSTLVQADLMFTGGVVQIIDSLLIPPTAIENTTQAFNLTSFEGSLYASNQLPTFSVPNVTIFAPNNEAFQALGPALTTMTAEELATVMDYHLISGSVIYSTALTNGTKLATLSGENITVSHSGNNVYINSAQLLTTDILIANGVLHVISNILNPQGPGAQPNPAIASQGQVFASASDVANLPFTSAIPCTSSCPVTSTTASSSTATTAATKSSSSAAAFTTSSSKGVGAALARETGGFNKAAGLMVALGGAVMML
ncbi:fasciclin domain-containing protein [Mollisia scopiformis]|uniref:Fasciclin domain-containing protein n=1 Tax=Mollisia scopiformis TaxID=149040 RepID=A0A194XTF2_MOLSC|nr:fasciclin domain-containing protein [Mollisia scopiformis]KUJ23329.1 fasciclin domain-containing protein [Mollisia scopiformis]